MPGPKFYRSNNKILNLYLLGLRRLIETEHKHKYNGGKSIVLIAGTVIGFNWLVHKMTPVI